MKSNWSTRLKKITRIDGLSPVEKWARIVVLLSSVCLVFVALFAGVTSGIQYQNIRRIIGRQEELAGVIDEGAALEDIGDLLIINTGFKSPRHYKGKHIKNIATLVTKDLAYENTVVSVNKDVYVPRDKKGKGSTIQGAYTYKKPGRIKKAINRITDLNNSYYISVDYKTIMKVVEKLFFIQLNIKQEEIEQINKNQERIAKKLRLFGVTPLTYAGRQQCNGLQTIAYMALGDDEKGNNINEKYFASVIKAIMRSLRKCNMEEILKVRSLIYNGDRDMETEYAIELVSRLRMFTLKGYYKWPKHNTKRTFKGTEYRFVKDVKKNAIELHSFLGEPDYVPSKNVKKEHIYTIGTLKEIKRLKKLAIEKKKREREEARRRELERQRQLEEQQRQEQISATQTENETDTSSETDNNKKSDTDASKSNKDKNTKDKVKPSNNDKKDNSSTDTTSETDTDDSSQEEVVIDDTNTDSGTSTDTGSNTNTDPKQGSKNSHQSGETSSKSNVQYSESGE